MSDDFLFQVLDSNYPLNFTSNNSITEHFLDLSFPALPTAAPPTGWTGIIIGVTNPSKINGIAVANITKVNGVS